MIRFNLKLILACTLAFLALNVSARALGGMQPPNPALRGFTEGCEGKPQPCWYGIVPGVTTVEETRNKLPGLGYAGDVYGIEFSPQGDRELYNVEILSIEGNLMALGFTPVVEVRVGDILTPLLAKDWQISFDCQNRFFMKVDRNWSLVSEVNRPFAQVSLFFISWETIPLDNINWRGFTFDWHYQKQGRLSSPRCS